MPDALTAALCADVLGARFYWAHVVTTGPDPRKVRRFSGRRSGATRVINAVKALRAVGCV